MSSNAPGDEAFEQPPDLHEKVKRYKASSAAGGFQAIWQSLRHTLGEMGLYRSVKSLLLVNQKRGFDCPGCAWPEGKKRSRFEFCENGAKAIAEEATRKKIDASFFEKFSVEELAKWSDFKLGRSGRLTHPMVLDRGATHYREISWKEGIRRVAEALKSLPDPNRACFYTSGRASNEAAFLYQLFVRMFGTNNLPDCSNMCHESSGVGLSSTIGIGKGTVSLGDFEKADAVFVIGQNPGTNHPRMLTALRSAKRKGAKIVSINPLREVGLFRFKHPQKVGDMFGSGTELTDLYLQVKINGDVAALKGVMKRLFEMESERPGSVLDMSFIETNCEGFEAFRSDTNNTDWGSIEEGSGLTKEELGSAAEIYAKANRVIICWSMGLTQHVNGVSNVQSCVNLLLMRGNFGREGAGACPVRGHSNVQGNRTVGVWENAPDSFLQKIGEVMNFDPPRGHGLAVVPAIEAMKNGKVSVFFGLGGNFISATPDTDYTDMALRSCDMTVHVSTKLNRSHLVTGKEALIFPCLVRSEIDEQPSGDQFVTVEDSMGLVHRSEGHLEPASQNLWSEVRIVAELAAEVLDGKGPDWLELSDDYDKIRDLIEKVIPGFERFNERVREPDGFELPNGPRSGRFGTPNGRACFTINPIPNTKLKSGRLQMMTIRSHDQYNTTIYGLHDRYRGVSFDRRIVLVNRKDLDRLNITDNERVDITSSFGGRNRIARNFLCVAYDIPEGCCATYFPEANVLVPIEKFAERSLTPASKSVEVQISKRN